MIEMQIRRSKITVVLDGNDLEPPADQSLRDRVTEGAAKAMA